MNRPCVTLAVMRAMHAPVSPCLDVVSHARMLCAIFRDLRRFGHDARLRCIINIRGGGEVIVRCHNIISYDTFVFPSIPYFRIYS